MSVHHRSTTVGACVIAASMLSAAPICAAPADYIFDVQEIGPQHSHITIRLRNVNPAGNGGQPVPVSDATIMIDAIVGPETFKAPTMT